MEESYIDEDLHIKTKILQIYRDTKIEVKGGYLPDEKYPYHWYMIEHEIEYKIDSYGKFDLIKKTPKKGHIGKLGNMDTPYIYPIELPIRK